MLEMSPFICLSVCSREVDFRAIVAAFGRMWLKAVTQCSGWANKQETGAAPCISSKHIHHRTLRANIRTFPDARMSTYTFNLTTILARALAHAQ